MFIAEVLVPVMFILFVLTVPVLLVLLYPRKEEEGEGVVLVLATVDTDACAKFGG